MSAWLLPESVADVLPSEARRIEELRRSVLDRFRVYGYELVMPPLLEYTESLLGQADTSLNLQTFKLLDQASGRMLGLRADTTPQVARIDAHILNRNGATRLCYCGPVLHTQALGLHNTREPLQCGAELYGCSGVEADLEILSLAVDTLTLSRLKGFRFALSHAGLLAALLEDHALEHATLRAVHAALAQKDHMLLSTLLQGLPSAVVNSVLALLNLYGPVGGSHCALAKAKASLPQTATVLTVLEELNTLVTRIQESIENPPIILIDLADVAGFEYHSGLIFSAFVEGCPNAILRGGRYDDVGAVYGRARPATGFSVDLRELVSMLSVDGLSAKSAIRAPWLYDTALVRAIRELRDQGEVVVQALPNTTQEEEEFICDRELVLAASGWAVVAINAN